MDDVRKMKPHPEGLYKILGKREPGTGLYLGDNIDDALAAREAGVPFAAIIARGEHNYARRAAMFRELRAIALLPRAVALNALLQQDCWQPLNDALQGSMRTSLTSGESAGEN